MSLRYILGKSGTGKTTQCIEEITSTDNSQRIFYIVPEQFTLESEKNILSKKKAVININVLGFKHLAYFIVSKIGTAGRKTLDDTGRTMLIKKIILELRDKLDFYKNSTEKQGFADNIEDTINELMQYSVSPESLNELILNLKDGNLKEKLKDIILIFSKYKDYLASKYISGDGLLDILPDIIPYSIVKNSEIWIDGFKSFTPQENKIIEALLKHCKQVHISLSIAEKSISYNNISPFDEQYEVKRAITLITKIAKENKINIEEPLYLTKEHIKYNDEIKHLKDNYFKYKPKEYPKDVKNISIYQFNNMYQEIDKILSEVKKLVQLNNYRYRDIALIIGNSDYEVPLSIALKKYNIPNFLDSRKSVFSHPLITLMTSAIDIIAYNWDNNSIFKFLKTGYTEITFDEIFDLENYVIANGINKYKWNIEWKYGFRDEKHNDKPDKADIEYIRDSFFDILSPLKDNFKPTKKALVSEITKALFDVLNNINIKDRLEKEFNTAIENNDTVKIAINSEIWNNVVTVANTMTEILGDEKITLRDYSKILKAGLNTATIGIAPPTQDYLIIGDMERTRLPNIKAMFVLGANEGNIPIKLTEKGIFSDDEKHIIKENNIELAPDLVQMTNNGRLGIYVNLIKPTKYLIFSYPTGSITGKSLTISSVVNKIKSIFPQINEIVYDKTNIDDILTSKEIAFNTLITAIENNDKSDFINDLYWYFINDSKYSEKLNSIKKGLISQISVDYLDEKLLPILWNEVLEKGSVSKLESYAACPFRFYMNYILNAKEKSIYKLKYNDIGTLTHKIMEEFSKHIKKSGTTWENADRNYTDDFVDKHISEFVKNINSDIFESGRNSAILNKIIKATKLSLWANVEQIKASKFKPDSFEITFGRGNSKIPAIEIEVDNGKILKLNGAIDRVDKMLNDGSVYVKIVDYKSSSKSLDINQIYYGLQLQLMLYMNTLIQNKNYEAGGMFYFKINEPDLINAEDNKSNLTLDDFMLNRMALNGMFDTDLTEDLDVAKIKVMKRNKPVEILRDIAIDSNSKLDKFTLNKLLDYSEEIVKKIGGQMAKGNIEISPYQYNKKMPCDYCPYSIVCDFANSKQEKLRCIQKNDAEIWNKIIGNNEEK